MSDHSHAVLKAQDEVVGTKVVNQQDEDLGKIIEVMIDKESGNVAYLVLESGSFLGMGGKLFALPWHALTYDPDKEACVLNIDKDKLKNAPGFDKDHWPSTADKQWADALYKYYDSENYWK